VIRVREVETPDRTLSISHDDTLFKAITLGVGGSGYSRFPPTRPGVAEPLNGRPGEWCLAFGTKFANDFGSSISPRSVERRGQGIACRCAIEPQAELGEVKPFCRAFAELIAKEEPTRFVTHLKIADRRGRILVDWLRN
jgi:hypothetical protein